MITALWTFIFWLGGRGAIAATSMVYFGIGGLFFYQKKYTEFIAYTKLLIFTACAGFFLAEYLSIFSWNGFSHSVSRTVQATSLNSLGSGRLKLWEHCLQEIRNNLFFGLGPQGNLFVYLGRGNGQAHNVFLQFFLEWGLVGGLLFLFFLGSVFYKGCRMHFLGKNTPVSIYALSAGAILVCLSTLFLYRTLLRRLVGP